MTEETEKPPIDPNTLEPLQVSLLTGFLGSGKTSLLSRALREPRLGMTAVLVNELGDVALEIIDQITDEDRAHSPAVMAAIGSVFCSGTRSPY